MNIKEFNTEIQELIDNILQTLADNENKRKQIEKDIVRLVGNRTFDNDFSDIEKITGSKIINKIDDRNGYNSKYKRYHFSPRIEFDDFWLVFHISLVNKDDNFTRVHLKAQTNQSLLIDIQKTLGIKAFKHIVNNPVVSNKNISYFVIEKQKRGIE